MCVAPSIELEYVGYKDVDLILSNSGGFEVRVIESAFV